MVPLILGFMVVHYQRYRPSDSNNNVDVYLSSHDVFLK